MSTARGGGIRNLGWLEVTNSTIYGNRLGAEASEGGTAFVSQGAGLHNGREAEATLTHVTVAANLLEGSAAQSMGSSLMNDGGVLTVINSIVDDSSLTPCWGTAPIDGGNNFNSMCFPGRPDVTYLGPLAENGGPNATCALGGLSNARQAAGACALTTDQRGISRAGLCDSGAYETNYCTVDDEYEEAVEASGLSDDTCWGAEITVGVPQNHRHCDEDWVWFQPIAGKTYEITTLDLLYGAQTVLELSVDTLLAVGRDCGPIIAESDTGYRSKLFYTATHDRPVDLRITEAYGSYNPGTSPPTTIEGYTIRVRCIENCACTPPEGPDLLLFSDSADSAVTYEACSTVTVGRFIIEATADVTLRAGEAVVFNNSVNVYGDLTAEVGPLVLP